jgi:hypothetical protein
VGGQGGAGVGGDGEFLERRLGMTQRHGDAVGPQPRDQRQGSRALGRQRHQADPGRVGQSIGQQRVGGFDRRAIVRAMPSRRQQRSFEV